MNMLSYVKAPKCPCCAGVLLDMGKLPEELRLGICPYCMTVWLCEPMFEGETFNRWELMSFAGFIMALEKLTNRDIALSQ